MDVFDPMGCYMVVLHDWARLSSMQCVGKCLDLLRYSSTRKLTWFIAYIEMVWYKWVSRT